MDWPIERYVRVYRRDSVTWKEWSWEARALFVFMLRVANTLGIVDVGRHGVRGLAVLVDMPRPIVERAVTELIDAGTVTASDDGRYEIKNYVPAQEAKTSDAQRQRECRERRRDKQHEAERANCDTPPQLAELSQNVTRVTDGHTCHRSSQPVTPSRAEPSLAIRSTTLRSPKTASEPKNGRVIDVPETVSAVNWPAEAAVLWGSKTGEHFPEGRFGKAWKPLVSRYDWPPTKAGAELWLWNAIENEQRPGAKLRPEWFSRDGPRFIELAATPVVEDGVLTPHGHMINGSQP